jgi:hypothetical protein
VLDMDVVPNGATHVLDLDVVLDMVVVHRAGVRCLPRHGQSGFRQAAGSTGRGKLLRPKLRAGDPVPFKERGKESVSLPDDDASSSKAAGAASQSRPLRSERCTWSVVVPATDAVVVDDGGRPAPRIPSSGGRWAAGG